MTDVLVLTAGLLWTALTGHSDALALKTLSDSVGVPAFVTWAVANEETRHNTNPRVRGLSGEVGRFQIKPATARALCPRDNIFVWRGNTKCFLKMARGDFEATGSWRAAIARHNGGLGGASSPAAKAYTKRVEATIGGYTLTLLPGKEVL